MSKILEKAIAKVRKLSAEDQDTLGAVLLAMADDAQMRAIDLDDETRNAIREGLAQARQGEFVPEEEINALWQRLAL